MWVVIQSDMFTYEQLGQNTDIRCVIKFVCLPFLQLSHLHRKKSLICVRLVMLGNAPSTHLPGDPASSDSGAVVNGLQEGDGTTVLVIDLCRHSN